MPTYQEQGPQEYHLHYYILSDIGTPDGEFLKNQIVSLFGTIITADDLKSATEFTEENKPGASFWIGTRFVQVDVTPLAIYLENLREAKDELEHLTSEATVDDDDEEDAK